jgi:hypothetical protein
VEMDVDGRNNFSTPDRPQLKMVRSPSEESEEKGGDRSVCMAPAASSKFRMNEISRRLLAVSPYL